MQKLEKYKIRNYEHGNIFKRVVWYIFNEFVFNTFLPFPNAIKRVILKIFGANIGEKVVIKPKVKIKYPWHLRIGNNSWIGENVWIDNLGDVVIGDNVCISQGALIITGNHNYKVESFDLIVKNIIIEDGSWICAKSIVGPGVKCMAGSILTVGSVANSNLEKNCIYKGNPAKKIKDRKFK